MGIVVLSLFDGMSCGRIALDKLGIKVDKYFASEIDKHAIKVSINNYPDIIQIGDVHSVSYKDGTLITENGEFISKIDLLIGGSPCQDFSLAKVMGEHGAVPKGLSGERSSLFYEYLRIKNEVNPRYWLLENVKMNKSSKSQLDSYLGVPGVPLNSNLVSFQNRPRIYWSNIVFESPNNMGVSFQDFKQSGELDDYALKRTLSREKMWNNGNGRGSPTTGCKNITNEDKICCLTTKQDRLPNSGLIEYKDFCRYLTRTELEQAQTVPIGYTDCLSYHQACKVLGNGWTVDMIVHILSYMNFGE